MTNRTIHRASAEHKTDHALLIRMAAKWSIPRELAVQVIQRDLQCVYCRHIFAAPYEDRKTCPSWEHIVNDLLLINLDNIALCCGSCNSSKGKKSLRTWLESPYCTGKGITEQSMAPVAISALHEVEYENAQQHTPHSELDLKAVRGIEN